MFQLTDTNECNRLPWLPSQLVSLCEDISSDILKIYFSDRNLLECFN